MQYKNDEHWREIRCSGTLKNGESCRELLGMEYVFTGRIFIRCYRCNHDNIIRFRTPKKLLEPLIAQDKKDYKPEQ